MNVVMMISSLQGGGAERVVSIMSTYWAEKGWQVTLLTFDNGVGKYAYEIHPRIVVKPLNLIYASQGAFDSIKNNINRTFVIRNSLKDLNPDAVISFIDTANIRVLLATRGMSFPVIVSERTDPAFHQIGRVWSLLRSLTYPWADAVVLQSEEVKSFFTKRILRKSHVIPNPVIVPDFEVKSERLIPSPSLLAVGRLAIEKGYDFLIRSFSQLPDVYSDWHLVFVGDGPEKNRLTRLAEETGVSQSVHFVGWADNVNDYMVQADIFVQSSRYEGFPNALCEAMAVGLPVISTDCSGVNTILEGGKSGVIVKRGDCDGMIRGLSSLMSSKDLREKYGERGRSVVERFGIEKVMGLWENVIREVRK